MNLILNNGLIRFGKGRLIGKPDKTASVVQDVTSAMNKQISGMGSLFMRKGNQRQTSLPDFSRSGNS